MGPGDGLQQITLEWLTDEGQFLAAWPAWQLVVLVAVAGVPLLLAMFPLTAVAMAAGFLLGPVAGSAVTLVAVMASTEAGRRLSGVWLRARVLRAIEAGPRWQAADAALRERTLVLSICLRLAPLIPYGVGCWLLPMVRWRATSYVIGSVVGTLPLVVFSAWMGTQAAALVDRADVAGEVEGLQRAVLFACYAAMFAGIWIAAQAIRRGVGRWTLENLDRGGPTA